MRSSGSSVDDGILVRHLSHNSSRFHTACGESSSRLIPESSISDDYGATKVECGNESDVPRGGPDRRLRRTSSMAEEGALLKDEFLAMTSLAVPMIATFILEMIPGIVTLALVGRMEKGDDAKLYVDAAALAVMLYNMVALSTGFGLLTALDTLCASAHGANQPQKMANYLLTGMVVVSGNLLVVGALLYNAAGVLTLLGQPASVAREAGTFTMWMLPGLPFIYAYDALRKLSQARNETFPMVCGAVVSVVVNVASGYYLVFCTDLGWVGAALARVLGSVVMLPTLLLAMHLTDREFLFHIYRGFRLEEAIKIEAIAEFLHLGVPGMLQMMFEWCAFEALALLCGIFPDEDYAIEAIGANAIVMQVSSLTYMFYLGQSIAGNVRIGNALGAGDDHRAKMASYLSTVLGVFLALVTISFILSFRGTLPFFFTSDEDLTEMARKLFLVVALFQIPDAINGTQQGIFRAIGKQSFAAAINFVAYYVVGIPLGWYLAMPMGVGVEGLWLGMTVGLCCISIVGGIYLFQCDWRQLVVEAQERLSIAPGSKNDEAQALYLERTTNVDVNSGGNTHNSS